MEAQPTIVNPVNTLIEGRKFTVSCQQPGAPHAVLACGGFDSSSGRGFSHDAVRANATGIQIRLRISRISSSSRKQLWVGQVFFRFGTSGLQELVEAEARHSCLVQEPLDLLAKDRQLGLDDVPHEALINIRITVNQNVAEGNNAAVLTDARHDFFVQPASCARASPIISNCRSTAERNMALPR